MLLRNAPEFRNERWRRKQRRYFRTTQRAVPVGLYALSETGVTINGQAFPHLIYQLVPT